MLGACHKPTFFLFLFCLFILRQGLTEFGAKRLARQASLQVSILAIHCAKTTYVHHHQAQFVMWVLGI